MVRIEGEQIKSNQLHYRTGYYDFLNWFSNYFISYACCIMIIICIYFESCY